MIEIGELRIITRVTGTRQDTRLRALDAAAVEYVSSKARRYYGEPVAVTRQMVGDGTHTLWLEELITPGSTVPLTIIERSEPAGTDVVITAANDDGFMIRGDTITKLIRKSGGRWTNGYEYELAYTRGFDDENVPAIVIDIVGKLVAWWFERRIPAPKVGEVFTAPVPHHISEQLGTLIRQLV